MNRLPAEIIPLIMQHINQQNDRLTCSLVNRCFYRATLPFLWQFFAEGKHTDFEDEDEMMSKLIDCLEQQPPHPVAKYVQEIELYSRWTDTQLIRLMSLIGPQVEDVYIACGQEISDASFQQLPRYWPNLTALYSRYVSATQESMVTIAQQCPRLRTFHLGYCANLSPHTFAPFVKAGRQLEKVTLHNRSENKIWNYQTVLDLAQLPLKSLWFDHAPEVAHDILTSATHTWPHLTDLRLEDMCEVGDDRRLISFIKAHPLVTELTLDNCVLTNATLDAIATYMTSVTYVSLCKNKNISVQGVRRLVRNCFYLKRVELKDCHMKSYQFPEACFKDTVDDDDIIDDNDDSDDNDDNDNDVTHLDQDAIDKIQLIGPQCICDENDDDVSYDDDDKVWLRVWERSFVNLRLFGSGVA
ncbi:unnamed protein product [Absidia cylindrospora]